MKITQALFLLLALASSALAGERAALLIGNAAYQNGTSLPALDTPPLDVAAMGQALRAAQFTVTVEKDLTTAAMREKVVAFTRAHREAEALVVYVSGHGVQVDGENYLPGVDANLDTSAAMANLARAFPGMSAEEREGKEREVIRFTAGKQMVRLSVVLDALAATTQGDGRVRMIFLDTCRSPFRGAASKGMLGGKSGGGLAPVSERPGLFIGFAALANQEAQQNEPGHPSLFTEALAAQIRQPGLQLEQVFKRTSRAVTERSRALKKVGVIGEEQTPAAYSVLQEDFVFVPEKVLAKTDPLTSVTHSAETFTPLFDGRTLDGWYGDTDKYQMRGGILISPPGLADIISRKEYASFDLKFDVRLSAGANNGIGIWCAEDKGALRRIQHTGYEIQIVDDNIPKAANSPSWNRHGSIWGFVPPLRDAMKPLGQWNAHEVIVRGTVVTVLVNGVKVQEADLSKVQLQTDHRPRPDPGLHKGRLAFVGDTGTAEFRDARITEF